ncbi:SDR family oxidoreductase [SAR86 cluster bacterium]|jgi:3-oxoacyl-[acyl-carrier protein] reductase|uniref:SDR family oxidoreductase n=1 Tax=SAR86 cluster bacterium TaxID=2030880 RepID=A0A9Q8U022_9GAMM|nr:SDR family oxidoreductase [SAR86 cluster bacterium]
MSKVVLIGSSSAIAQSLQENSNREFVCFTRSNGFDISGDLSELDGLEDINGLVYFPGTINLKPFTMLKEQDYQNDLDINFLGAVKVVKKLIGKLKEADGASVVFISTVAASIGLPFHASISPAKAALEAYARSMAAEYAGAKISFNVVAPSLANTPMAENLLKTERLVEASKERNPMKEIGSPNQIAKVVDFLLDADQNWMTGQVIPVDGGMINLK